MALTVEKRDGQVVPFDSDKIRKAIEAANKEVGEPRRLTAHQVQAITKDASHAIETMRQPVKVEEIQDLVEILIMEAGGYETAQKYIRYRYNHNLRRGIDSYVKKIADAEPEELKGVADIIGNSLRAFFVISEEKNETDC